MARMRVPKSQHKKADLLEIGDFLHDCGLGEGVVTSILSALDHAPAKVVEQLLDDLARRMKRAGR